MVLFKTFCYYLLCHVESPCEYCILRITLLGKDNLQEVPIILTLSCLYSLWTLFFTWVPALLKYKTYILQDFFPFPFFFFRKPAKWISKWKSSCFLLLNTYSICENFSAPTSLSVCLCVYTHTHTYKKST